MRTNLLMGALALSLLTASCTTLSYYQLYKTSSADNLQASDKGLIYEDPNCIVTYNMWGEGGDAGFKFYNKTNENIYLNMEDSYFITNGIANNYYGNRVITSSSGETVATTKNTSVSSFGLFNSYYSPRLFSVGKSSSAGVASTKGQSVSYTEEKLIVIPAKTAKIIAEYSINSNVTRNCDLLRYPSKKQIKAVSYSSTNSPLTFSNRMSYRVGSNTSTKFENTFYISEITNHPTEEFFEAVKEKDCEGRNKMIKRAKYASPERFYITYNKAEGDLKY